MTCCQNFLAHLLLIALLLPSLPVSAQRRRPTTKQAKGLQFRLSEGRPNQEIKPAAPVTSPLSPNETEALLNRLQSSKTEVEVEQEFAFRDRSLPPPQTGKTISEAFPHNVVADAPVTPTSTLEVVRFAPEGEVSLAPHLTVTFSQPMVAVTSQAEAAQNVPVKLSPEVKGKWRWLGTKTLLFEPENRFPMATDFTVEVPVGTKSALGNALAETKKWNFSTPPPQLKSFAPTGEAISRDPLFFAAFDQRIDSATVLKTIKLTGAGKAWKLRLATTEEIQSDEEIQQRTKATNKDYWLAFRPIKEAKEATAKDFPLPAATKFNVSIEPGTASAEGERTTTKAQAFSFQTYGAFRIKKHGCDSDNKICEPNYDTLSIEFTNPLDEEAFDEKHVRIEPPIPNFKAENYGDSISIAGQLKPLTTYKVTLASAIKDEFGQTLGVTPPLYFRTGRSEPNFGGPDGGLHMLDPYGPRAISYYSINHPGLRVSLYSVTPEDWSQFVKYEESRNEKTKLQPPGRRIFSELIAINAKPEETIETRIDLTRALKTGFGHVVVIVEPTKRNRDYDDSACVWVQSTNIGLDALADNTDLIAWATSLKDGKSLEQVTLSIIDPELKTNNAASAITQKDGLAKIALPEKPAINLTRILLARRGDDSAFLPDRTSRYDQARWHSKSASNELRWHVFDDRGMYRPGEEVHVKGWVRRLGKDKGGDVEAVTNSLSKIAFTIVDNRHNEIAKGELTLNAFGGFDTAFKLPDNINLGPVWLQFKTPDIQTFTHTFQVQEFRRPEYEVTAQASAAPHFVGGQANVTVHAAYYAGGGLPNAEVNWNVTATPTNFTPPNRDEFTFGKWMPWWISSSDYEEATSQTFNSRTDATGKHILRVDFDSTDTPRPHSVKAEARVTDVNRQQWSASSTMLVHPADFYVGIRADRTFVQQGEALTGQLIVTDLDGKAIANRAIKVRAMLLDSTYKKGEWVEEEKDLQEFTLQSGNDAVPFRIATKTGGTYRITASIRDDKERRNESELTMWVAGGKTLPANGEVEQEEVKLIPNRKDYQAGDVAEILVQAPFYPAEGVMTLQRSGILQTERFTMSTVSHTLKIPIQEAWTPNIHVQVDLVGTTIRNNDKGDPDKSLPKRPAFASGKLELKLPPLQRKLNVTATPRHKALEPGGETTVDVEVKDAAGNAVTNGEIALVVVDEAILALSNYKLRDPLETFYTLRDGDVDAQHSREQLLLADDKELKKKPTFPPVARIPMSIPAKETPPQMTMLPVSGVVEVEKAKTFIPPPVRGVGIAGGMGAGSYLSLPTPIKARVNFNPLAAFVASAKPGANGKAAIKVKLPDSLTRYRVMALATDGAKKFGIHEAAITARMPLMVRPSAPRFLNFGDRFELPVVLQNQTDEAMVADVAVRATNAALQPDTATRRKGDTATSSFSASPRPSVSASGQRVTIPANDRVEVRFPASTIKPGKAHFQIAAATVVNDRSFADAAEVSLPVWTPATTEAFATYGEIDVGAMVQPIKAPADAIKQFGGLEITTSSTQLQALTDAVLYLTSYPYECAEQISSRVLAIAALRDVLSAFAAKGLPSPQELQAAIARDLKKLEAMQNADGGFGFWRRGEKSWPYLSIHVAHALQRAKEKDFAVPQKMLADAQIYLATIERHIPADYPIEVRRTLLAYSLYVRHRLGNTDSARAQKLIAEAGLENLSLEAIGWLLPVVSAQQPSGSQVVAMRKYLNNRVEETAATAHFTSAYKDGAHLLLASNRRADGVLLEALIGDQPNSDLIPKLVRGLLAQRKQGRWLNTQENAFVLLALDRYFRTYENVTQNFVVRVWLGDACANEQTFAGRSTDRHQLNVPMKFIAGQSNLTLNKQGQGRLYYRIGMQYAPSDLQQKAADYGFTVERSYEAIDDPNDVRRDADGTWRIKAGANVRVRLTLVAPTRRYHVALVDPLPAGLEPLNPALAITGEIPKDEKEKPSRYWWWNRPWYEHQNLRDERVEAFTSLLWEGVYNYAYVARATTPGNFIAPPAKAEEMYQPETFGRSASDKVIIE